MSEIFLSASVPVEGRGDFHKTADPYLIQFAVREFVAAVLGRRKIVFGGHPSITPMVWAVCEDLGVSFADWVVLYQSRFFAELFPEENARFKNVEYIDAAPDGKEDASLERMREAMLSRPNLSAAVFIGGMKGVLAEYAIFNRHHPEAKVLALAAPGGAARQLATQLAAPAEVDCEEVNFARLFYKGLGISPLEAPQRTLAAHSPPLPRRPARMA